MPSESATAVRKGESRDFVRDRFECASDVAIAQRVDGEILVATRNLALSDELPRLGGQKVYGPPYTVKDGCSRFVGAMKVAP